MTHTLFLTDQHTQALDDLQDGQSQILLLDELSVIVLRQGNKLYAYLNTCPHNGKKLASKDDEILDESGSLIECQHHGAQFSPTSGTCVSGPCIGKHLQPLQITRHTSSYQLQANPGGQHRDN